VILERMGGAAAWSIQDISRPSRATIGTNPDMPAPDKDSKILEISWTEKPPVATTCAPPWPPVGIRTRERQAPLSSGMVLSARRVT